MRIRAVSREDIPRWVALSREYDRYAREAGVELEEWYHGGDSEASNSFDYYMETKINAGEAFMAVTESDACAGIIAISTRKNGITFFAVSHQADFGPAGEALLHFALSRLRPDAPVMITEIKSGAEYVRKSYTLLERLGFVYQKDVLENGSAVNYLERPPIAKK